MGLIKEPKNVDFTVQSEPWTEEELKDFRKLMSELKAKTAKKKAQSSTKKEKLEPELRLETLTEKKHST
jgi:hypothetical protein